MKVLFVSEFISAKAQGAYMSANAHYKSFCDIFGQENIEVISIKTNDNEEINNNFIHLEAYKSRKDKLLNLLNGYTFFCNKSIERYIVRLVKTKKYDLIFFDNNSFGSIIKKIKKMNIDVSIWSFFHGISANSSPQSKRRNYKPQVILSKMNWKNQEKKTVQYSDKCILLNKRDEKELINHYNRKADMLLPVYYIDTAKIKPINNENEFRILFVGGKFWPNILGITWFAKNVMPHLDKKAKLYVVGREMEFLREEIYFKNRSDIKVIGGTDDLSYWYNSADIVVGPIFHGDGMKTKTAEALMYGKRYIGTSEALCGYTQMEKFCCNTAEEFIYLINEYIKNGVSKYYPEMRKLYEDNYSVDSANKKIIELVKQLENKNEK